MAVLFVFQKLINERSENMSYLKGIDISNNNGNLNLSSLKGKIDVVYMKATEGATFKDSYMDGFYKQCKSNGFRTGAYHFLVATSTPEAQAINFYNKIKNYTWDCYPMLDVETITGFTSATLCNYVTRFITKWKSLSSLPLGIYSYTSFIPYLNSIQNTIKNMPFWEANYNGKPFILQNTFFTNRIGHQYSEKGIVGNFKGDVNVFTEGALINKKYYVVTNYLPAAYKGYDGVDINYVLSYFKDIKCYMRSNEKGMWIETQYLPKEKCEELKKTLGSWFYEIAEE